MLIPEEIGDEPLAQEKVLVKNAKKIGILATGLAAQKFGDQLQQEQEILVNIADIASLAYAAESVVLRTEKAIAKTGLEKNQQKLLYTQIFVQEAFNEIEQHAKETLIAVESGDMLRIFLSSLRKLTRHTPINVIAKKREASVKLIEAEKYMCITAETFSSCCAELIICFILKELGNREEIFLAGSIPTFFV